METNENENDRAYEGMTVSSKLLFSAPERNFVLHTIPTTDVTNVWQMAFKKTWSTIVFIQEETDNVKVLDFH